MDFLYIIASTLKVKEYQFLALKNTFIWSKQAKTKILQLCVKEGKQLEALFVKILCGEHRYYTALGYFLFTRTLKAVCCTFLRRPLKSERALVSSESLVALSVAPPVQCSAFLRTGAKEWKHGRAQNIFTSFLTFGTTFFCSINDTFCTMCLCSIFCN